MRHYCTHNLDDLEAEMCPEWFEGDIEMPRLPTGWYHHMINGGILCPEHSKQHMEEYGADAPVVTGAIITGASLYAGRWAPIRRILGLAPAVTVEWDHD